MARHAPERPSDVCRRLEREGWQRRAGRGDHVNYNKAGQPAVITVDNGDEGDSDRHPAIDLSQGRLEMVSG